MGVEMNRRSSKRRSSKRPIRPNLDIGPSGRTFEKVVSGDGTRESPIVVETVDDVDALLRSPGFYLTTSTFPAYAVAKALDGWHPLFKGGTDLPYVEGSVFYFQVLASERARLEPNTLVAMGVSPDYWTKLLQRYTNWERGWWREVAQNSRDAAATEMDFNVVEGIYKDPESGGEVPAMVVTAYDNGKGMDADTLRRALLTRGGSVKEVGSVGGFGDAKNLILFPWLGWKVETNSLLAFGQHEGVAEPPGIHTVSPGIRGTRITVWMPLTQTTTIAHAQQLLGRSNLPGVRTRVNGAVVKANLIDGEQVAKAELFDDSDNSVGEIVAYYQRNARANKGLYVRARGVFMFEQKVNSIPGVVYVDVNAPAKYVFDASRNALVGAALEFVDKIKIDLAQEPEVVLRSQKWNSDMVFRGTGSIDVRTGRAAEIAAKAAARIAKQVEDRAKSEEGRAPKKAKTPKKVEAKEVADEAAKTIEEEEASNPVPTTPEEEMSQRVKSSRETATNLIYQVTARTPATTVEPSIAAIRFAAWTPDLYVANQMPFWKLPPSLSPATMEEKYVFLLRVWTEACKFGLATLGEFKPFGVGFVMMLSGDIGEPVLGAQLDFDGTSWLMINPLKFKRGEYDWKEHAAHWSADGDRLDLKTDVDIESLCSTAIHEITHLQGFKSHGPGFASALTENIKAALRGMFDYLKDQLPTIRSETRARFAEVRQEKAAAKVAKTTPWPLVVGRVILILEFWDSLRPLGQDDLNDGTTEIDTVAKDAGRHDYQMPLAVSSVMKKTYKPPLDLKPKLIVKLHDAALAAGAFKLVTDEEAIRASEVVNSIPEDPRSRQKLEAITPDGTFVFSWVRTGKEWVLREGFTGQRGVEVWRYEGGTGPYDRGRQRQESVGHIGDFLNKRKAEWSGSENIYVWFANSSSQWQLDVDNFGRALWGYDWDGGAFGFTVTFEDGRARLFSSFPSVSSGTSFDTVAKAQQAVMEAIFQRRKEQRF